MIKLLEISEETVRALYKVYVLMGGDYFTGFEDFADKFAKRPGSWQNSELNRMIHLIAAHLVLATTVNDEDDDED